MLRNQKRVKTFVEKANAAIRYYLGMLKTIIVCISAGNRKIGRIWNVSILPIFSCGNCKRCAGICYDIKANVQYGNVLNARARNYVLARYNMPEFFRQIGAFLSNYRGKNKFFRFHVCGEILNYEYFARLVETARNHPDWFFYTYTKMYGIVNSYIAANIHETHPIPTNFVIMFSEWDGVEMDNPYNMPTFSCKLKGGNVNHPAEYFDTLYKCPGNCDVCKAARRGCFAGENVYADEH